MPASRVLDLTGSCNLRDFGGYATRDGRRLRQGRLFRSGVLNRLAPDAVRTLQALPLRAVCDLRRAEERRLEPNPHFGHEVRTFQWESTVETSPIRERSFAQSTSIDEARDAMRAMYRRIPFLLQGRLAGVFEALAHAGDGAVVVHCSAGKDRTGVAVALVLAALAVPRETIVEDYVLTNAAVDLRLRLLGEDATGVGLSATADPIRALPPLAREAVLDAHPSYLLAALEAIEARHGSIERYLGDELRLDTSLLSRVRASFLED
ncbi:MAG TPA: tyrosine-protein phosphatase [Steroidobacteraceae bacterium]|nr:tyrosine-protein phosphatase [Steroidobacteraceae bacterium]